MTGTMETAASYRASFGPLRPLASSRDLPLGSGVSVTPVFALRQRNGNASVLETILGSHSRSSVRLAPVSSTRQQSPRSDLGLGPCDIFNVKAIACWVNCFRDFDDAPVFVFCERDLISWGTNLSQDIRPRTEYVLGRNMSWDECPGTTNVLEQMSWDGICPRKAWKGPGHESG